MDLPKVFRDLFSKKEENTPQTEQSVPIVKETQVQPEKKDLKRYETVFTGDFPTKEKKEAAAELAGSESSYSNAAKVFLQSDEERIKHIMENGLGSFNTHETFTLLPDSMLAEKVNDPFYAKYGFDQYFPEMEKCQITDPEIWNQDFKTASDTISRAFNLRNKVQEIAKRQLEKLQRGWEPNVEMNKTSIAELIDIYTGVYSLEEKKKVAKEIVVSGSAYSPGAELFIQSDEERLGKIAKEGLGTWQVDNKVQAFFWIHPENELFKEVQDPFYTKYGLDKYIAPLEKCAGYEPDPFEEPIDPYLSDEELEKEYEQSRAFHEKLEEDYADYYRKIAEAEKIQQEVKEVAAAALAKLQQQKEQSFGADDLLVLDGQLRQIGLSLETLRQKDDNSVNNLIEGRRTALFPIKPAIAGIEFQTEARLSMRKNEAGQPQLFLHPVKQLLSEELEKPFHGHTFTNEQKRLLMATGNAGEVISITGAQGTPEKVLVSVDRQVNDLVAVPVEKVQRQIPNTFQNQPLNQEQKDLLLAGRPVSLDNIQSKDGNVFSGKIQYNAEKQKVELLPDGLNVTQIRNVVLQEREQQLLREGKTILVPGLIDGKGEQYSGWIRLDMKSRQITVSKEAPSQRVDTRKEITPGGDFKIQVSHNSKGLKTEENKHVVEPLRHGQTKEENNKKGMKL